MFVRFFAVFAFFIFNGNFLLASDPEYLDPYNRPKKLQEHVDDTFNKLKDGDRSYWNYNGSSDYYIAGIDPKLFLRTLVKTSPDQKEFWIMDMGSGDGSWGRSLVKYINEQKDLGSDTYFRIFNLTGDSYPDEIIKKKNCTLYSFGSFPLENIGSALPEKLSTHGIEGDIQFDLIVSKYTFVHFHDPVGTWGQTFNLLRPMTGHMLMDGLNICFSDNRGYPGHYSLEFLLMLKYPFLSGSFDFNSIPHRFLLKRPDENKAKIPLKYDGLVLKEHRHATKKLVAKFKVTTNRYDKLKVSPRGKGENAFCGDKALYDWMATHHQPWVEMDTAWYSLTNLNDREERKSNSIFKAIHDEDFEQFKNHIANGIDMGQTNGEGNSVLHQVSRCGNLEMLNLIIQNCEIENLSNIKDVLTRCRFLDFETYRKLADLAGIGLNDFVHDKGKMTFLYLAVKFKREKLVESLLAQDSIDPSIKDKRGRTAFDLGEAKEESMKKIIDAYKKRVGWVDESSDSDSDDFGLWGG